MCRPNQQSNEAAACRPFVVLAATTKRAELCCPAARYRRSLFVSSSPFATVMLHCELPLDDAFERPDPGGKHFLWTPAIIASHKGFSNSSLAIRRIQPISSVQPCELMWILRKTAT